MARYEPALIPELVVRWTPSTVAPPLEFQKTLLLTWPMFTQTKTMLHFLKQRWSCPSVVPKVSISRQDAKCWPNFNGGC